MKKLKLEIDLLTVQSFAVTGPGKARSVFSQEASNTTCDDDDHPAPSYGTNCTGWQTCIADTCGEYTCAGGCTDTAQQTCNYSCQVTVCNHRCG